jgi:broad specificity phosphatase PhoE
VADLLAALRGPAILVTHGVVLVALRAALAGRGPEAWDALDDPQGVVLVVQDGRERVLNPPAGAADRLARRPGAR